MWTNVERRIKQVLNAIRLPFRGVLKRVNSNNSLQTVQAVGLSGEQLQDNELMQHYGFTSNPPANTEAVVVPLHGTTSHGIIIATEHGSYRLKSLATGEVAIYTDEETKIVLKRNRIIEVDCDDFILNCKTATTNCNTYTINADTRTDINTPTVTASEQLIAQAQITGNGGMSIRGGKGSSSAVFEGKIQITDDVIAGNISLVNHTHRDSQNGNTGKPL